jgi:hypothetical protein
MRTWPIDATIFTDEIKVQRNKWTKKKEKDIFERTDPGNGHKSS